MSRRATMRAGRALLPALLALAALAPQATAATRQYWVAAVPVQWDVVPSGRDPMTGMTFAKAQTRFPTVVYRLYSRGWRRPLGPPKIPGPLLRARVGDRILVHFKNLDTLFHRAHSMHFHGVHYPFASDGSYIPGISGRGANVKPGQSFTYRLRAGTDSAGAWPYHDHGPSMDESIGGGMFGMLSILPRRAKAPDREFVVVFAQIHGFMTIDGRSFLGNTPVFRARVGQRVRFDVMTIGDDFHTFHVHGHRWIGAGGQPEDVRTVGPAESFAVSWREDRPGAWLYHCHVESHMMEGMIGLYVVRR
jgi:FtsP/CotA-like multicopper oxidase with cupredoxin domain